MIDYRGAVLVEQADPHPPPYPTPPSSWDVEDTVLYAPRPPGRVQDSPQLMGCQRHPPAWPATRPYPCPPLPAPGTLRILRPLRFRLPPSSWGTSLRSPPTPQLLGHFFTPPPVLVSPHPPAPGALLYAPRLPPSSWGTPLRFPPPPQLLGHFFTPPPVLVSPQLLGPRARLAPPGHTSRHDWRSS